MAGESRSRSPRGTRSYYSQKVPNLPSDVKKEIYWLKAKVRWKGSEASPGDEAWIGEYHQEAVAFKKQILVHPYLRPSKLMDKMPRKLQCAVNFKAGVTLRGEDHVVKGRRKEAAGSSREEGGKDHNSYWYDHHHHQNYKLYHKSMAVAGVLVHLET